MISLTGEGIRCQLGIAEGIHDAMVANPIPGSEILVGGVVKHTPAKTTHVAAVCHGIIQHPHMAQSVLLAATPGVEGFCGEHMPVMF